MYYPLPDILEVLKTSSRRIPVRFHAYAFL